jgi:hypothetical protein
VVEVLPESERLAAELRDIALAWQVPIHVVPGCGSDRVVNVAPETFSSTLPVQHRSKDVLLGHIPTEILRD